MDVTAKIAQFVADTKYDKLHGMTPRTRSRLNASSTVVFQEILSKDSTALRQHLLLGVD